MYYLYDYYEGKQFIDKSEDWFEIQKLKKQYLSDTDGECDLDIIYIPEKESDL